MYRIEVSLTFCYSYTLLEGCSASVWRAILLYSLHTLLLKVRFAKRGENFTMMWSLICTFKCYMDIHVQKLKALHEVCVPLNTLGFICSQDHASLATHGLKQELSEMKDIHKRLYSFMMGKLLEETS